MSTLFLALAPIFSLIMIGAFLKNSFFKNEQFWQELDKLTYYILIPSMLIYKLANASIPNGYEALDMVKVIFLTLILISIVLIVIQKILKFDGAAFSSIYQGAVRYNTYVYLALIDTYLGNEGMVLAALLITFAIPFLNILSVSIFSIYVNEGGFSLSRFSKFIVSNPLILACLVGGFLNFSGIGLPFIFKPLFFMLGSPGIPLGLISIGAGLSLGAIFGLRADFWISSFFKLILFPMVTLYFSYLFGLNEIKTMVVALFAAMPTAASSYILARQMGGNVGLMSSIITGQTLLAFATIFAFLHFLL